MRALPLCLIVLAACGAEPLATAPVDAPAVPGVDARRGSMVLVGPGVAGWGTTATYEVHGSAPGETVYLLRSTRGEGAGPCPSEVGGRCLGIRGPVKLAGSATTDVDGVATVTLALPAMGPAPEVDVSFQAAVVRGLGGADSLLSNALTTTITDDPVLEDVFAHQPPSIDLLFVIDNSCSMDDEQAAIAASVPAFLPPLDAAGVDYHIGVITTDMDDPTHRGRLQEGLGIRWIDATTPDPHRVFDDMARQGTNGAAQERGLQAVFASIATHGGGYNAGFFRADAQLSTFILSDEDDASAVPAADFASWYQALPVAPRDATFHSIVDLSGCGFGALRYLDVTALVGGATWDVCAGSYDGALAAAARLWWSSRPMALSMVPDPATVEVFALEPGAPERALSAAEWGYEPADNSVRTRAPYFPPAGTTITVRYEP